MKREKNQMWVVKAPDGRVYYDEARKFRTVALAVFVVSRGRQVKWRWYYNRKWRCVRAYVYTETRGDCSECLFDPKRERE